MSDDMIGKLLASRKGLYATPAPKIIPDKNKKKAEPKSKDVCGVSKISKRTMISHN
jgi:hypothetical protein